MAAKKQQTKALANKQTTSVGLASGTKSINEGLTQLAVALSGPLTVPQLTMTLHRVKGWVDDVDALYQAARKHVIALLEQKGERDEETGKVSLTDGNVTLSMRPWRTGFDPKKVERMLRSKGKDVARYMTPTLTYKVDEEKLLQLKMTSQVTDDELEACKYDVSWTVESPTIGGEDNDD